MKNRFVKSKITRLKNRAFIKVYYFFVSKFLVSQTNFNRKNDATRKRIVLYFDYEREFGNSAAKISDEQIMEILVQLNKYKLKTTWFTVGKIFKYYPNSIAQILHNGHEIASHTYNHTPPFLASSDYVKNDFLEYNVATTGIVKILGFHAPNGMWSFQSLKNTLKNGYNYDVVSQSVSSKNIVASLLKLRKNKLIRLYTLGDDWGLYNKGFTATECFHYFKNMIETVNYGEIRCIGIHPWVLYSCPNIYHGFLEFIEYLYRETDLDVNTANFFAEGLLKLERD